MSRINPCSFAIKLDRDASLITAWSTSPSPEIAGALAGCPFDAVTIDMQHGSHDERSAFAAMQ
jgi:4-hydroxy-2-oxoheptanedioate aldolase